MTKSLKSCDDTNQSCNPHVLSQSQPLRNFSESDIPLFRRLLHFFPHLILLSLLSTPFAALLSSVSIALLRQVPGYLLACLFACESQGVESCLLSSSGPPYQAAPPTVPSAHPRSYYFSQSYYPFVEAGEIAFTRLAVHVSGFRRQVGPKKILWLRSILVVEDSNNKLAPTPVLPSR